MSRHIDVPGVHFITRLPPVEAYRSPIYVPSVLVPSRIRPKDRTLVDQAIEDRWGNGAVWDENPRGAVYDLLPPAHGRFASNFPQAPESVLRTRHVDVIGPDELDDDQDLIDQILGERSNFGSAAAIPASAPFPSNPSVSQAMTAARQAMTPAQQAAVAKVSRSLASAGQSAGQALTTNRPTPVVIAPPDRTTEMVVAGLGILAAFGIGYVAGQKSRTA